MDALVNVLLVALAGNAVLTAWKDGSLFAEWRAYFEVRGDKLGELMTCALCLSYHCAFWVAVILLLPAYLLDAPWNWLFKIPLISLAATDLIHWMRGIKSDDNYIGGYEPNGSTTSDQRDKEEVPASQP